MLNGWKTAKKRYNEGFQQYEQEDNGFTDKYDDNDEKIPVKGIRPFFAMLWIVLNIRITLIYNEWDSRQSIVKQHNKIYVYGFKIVRFPKWLVLFPFRLIVRPFGWVWDKITKPMRYKDETGDYELEQVLIRYPHASEIKCVKCDEEMGFHLNEYKNKGWRYTQIYWQKPKRFRPSWFSLKLKLFLIRIGITWENAFYLTTEGEFVDDGYDLGYGLEYVSPDGDCIFSLDETEGDVCGGCVESAWSCGVRFKIYEDGNRTSFVYRDGLARADDCMNAGDYWDEIKLHLGFKEQDEENPIKELADLNIQVFSHKDKHKYALIEIADEFDVPLFAVGCGDIDLYSLPEHEDLFQDAQTQYNNKGEIDLVALAKQHKIEYEPITA